MAATTEQRSASSTKELTPLETLCDQFQKTLTLPSPSEDQKSCEGKLYNSFIKCFKKAAAVAAASPNGIAARNNTGEGSSSQKKKIPKTYDDPHMVRGFERDEMSLEIMLLHGGRDDSFKTVGVVGLPGVGKTTLCKSILKNERVKGSYSRRIWVSLSEKPKTKEETVERTLEPEDMLEHISDERELPGLLDALNQQLKENKYLIVLDDVGDGEEDSCYEALKTCFIDRLPKEKGGSVIVTCRSEEAAKKMVGDKNLYRLQPLSDPMSCWLIYNDAALDGCATPEEAPISIKVMEELMKKCGGLPVVAQMLGKIKAQKMKNTKRN